ncbi:MAG: transporter substrate-binding domain-containing protein, partial [Bermanella sp.]
GFDEAGIAIEEVTSDEQNILKLHKGRIDLALIDKGVGQYIINNKLSKAEAESIEWMGHDIKTNIQYIGFSKKVSNYQKKLRDFNLGLVRLIEEGGVKRIMNKHGL